MRLQEIGDVGARPSPFGRRWPEGPDEGVSELLSALTRPSATLSRRERALATTFS